MGVVDWPEIGRLMEVYYYVWHFHILHFYFDVQAWEESSYECMISPEHHDILKYYYYIKN